MSTTWEKQPDAGGLDGPAAPPFPATSAEFINALAHFHRAEIARMAGWRDRIDRTTNWAITVVAGMLSVSLSTPASHHGVLLFAMVLVLLLLSIEARRYRFFDVYRARVRQLTRGHVGAEGRAGNPAVEREHRRQDSPARHGTQCRGPDHVQEGLRRVQPDSLLL